MPRGRFGADRHVQMFTDEDRQLGAARKHGMTLDEYRATLGAGLKWCFGCQNWHDRDKFGPNRSTNDGLNAACRDYRRTYNRRYAQRRQRQRSTPA